MSAAVEVLLIAYDEVISVPVASVVRYEGEDHVAVKSGDAGAVEWRVVNLGATDGQSSVVVDGLDEGSRRTRAGPAAERRPETAGARLVAAAQVVADAVTGRRTGVAKAGSGRSQ